MKSILKLSSPFSFSHIHPNLLRSHLLLLIGSAAGEDVYGCSRFSSYSSSFSSPCASSPSRRNYDEENRSVKVTVWWDFENCNIPVGVNVHRVASRITWAVRSSSIKGPVTITAFGDVAQLSRATQEALTFTGICLTHVPNSGKNSSDRSFMADVVYWVYQNPPPAHFFLISGDKDFANILHRLRMSNYNILLSTTETASGVLCSAATIMWPWNELVRGENAIVRHFNYPPDGLSGSWYGHYKGALDDPFAFTDHPTTSQADESMELISEMKPRPVPRTVVNGIRQVLHSYPEGISLTELRSELKKSNITIDKDFFGHKNFSNLLASLNLLKYILTPSGDRQPLAVGTLKKGMEQPEISLRFIKDVNASASTLSKVDNKKLNANASAYTFSKGDNSNLDINASVSAFTKGDNNNLDANASDSALSKGDHSVVALEGCEGGSSIHSSKDDSDTSQHTGSIILNEGLLKRLRKILSRDRVDSVLKKEDNILPADFLKHEDPSKFAAGMRSSEHAKQVQPKNNSVDSNNIVLQKENAGIGLDADKPITKDNDTFLYENFNYADEQKVGLFGRIMRRLKPWIYGSDEHNHHSDSCDDAHRADAAGGSDKALPVSSGPPTTHELFSKSHFWNELESFLTSPIGCQLILKSRTREQLLRRLQNEGPASLRGLGDRDLSNFGDILLSEKKWVEVSHSSKFPFRLVITSKIEQSIPSHQPSPSKGLGLISSLFPVTMKPSPQEEQSHRAPHNLTELRPWFQRAFGGAVRIKPEEFLKVFESEFCTKLSSTSYGYPNVRSLVAACSKAGREGIIADCCELLKELLEKNPAGFNASIFQPEFVRKYSYILNYQSLGYSKLVSMLQIMPGIRIENSYILPSGGAKEDLGDGESSGSENGFSEDSVWEELGPLSNSSVPQKGGEYSPVSLSSDDEYTDPDDEDVPPSPTIRTESCRKGSEDASALLKILNSWSGGNVGGKDRIGNGDQKLRATGLRRHHSFVKVEKQCLQREF